ncbi:MAG: hypothetical protein Q7R82_02225 [Candidatus Daviesbacteria bacterium]|nr:hypothetical protein [Candidatus Daviesbacteria bacterium]
MEQRNGVGGFLQLLESSAAQLRKEGSFTIELSPADLEQTMRQVVAQSEEAMKKKGVAAKIDSLGVQINDGRGAVSITVTASKKVGFLNPSVSINATFGMENITDPAGNPTGRLRTTRLEVQPETLFMVVKPKDFLAPHIDGENVNNAFRSVLDSEMQRRGAMINNMDLAFTQGNTLKIAVTGSRR